jgi:hypothetical protein
VEAWRVRRDGSRFWAEATLVAVRNESGLITGFAKIVRDISERRRAQDALDRAREALTLSQKMEVSLPAAWPTILTTCSPPFWAALSF